MLLDDPLRDLPHQRGCRSSPPNDQDSRGHRDMGPVETGAHMLARDLKPLDPLQTPEMGAYLMGRRKCSQPFFQGALYIHTPAPNKSSLHLPPSAPASLDRSGSTYTPQENH